MLPQLSGGVEIEFRSRGEFSQEYLVNQLLGKGGYGSVFAGVRKYDCLPVAIKRVPWWSLNRWDMTENGGQIPMELSLLQKAADCPGVVQLVDFCRDEDDLILVMEYDEKAFTLHTRIKKRLVFEESEAARILHQLIRTLLACQKKGIFHRDVKMENVLYNKTTGKVTLIDFGCGETVNSPTQRFTEFEGTQDFIPPEYFLNGSYLEEPTTVWSIGCLAYCMIFGRIPFSKRSDVTRHRLEMNHGISSQYAKVFVQRCLQPQPASRPTLVSLLAHPWLTEDTQNNTKGEGSSTPFYGSTTATVEELLDAAYRKIVAEENMTNERTE